MDRVAIITGATSGFGAATARRLAKDGWKLVLTGRRQERLDDMVQELGGPERVLARCMDMRERQAVETGLGDLPEAFAAVELLVNNAGLAKGLEPAWEYDVDDWEVMIDTNIKGLLYATHTVLPGMVERNHGHIVNLGSTAASWPYVGGNTYGGTKAFVQQFTRNLRADLTGRPIRATLIEPGLCETEFSVVRFGGDAEKARSLYAGKDPIRPEDIAETIWWVVNMPAHVNINRIEMMPVSQSWAPLSVTEVKR